MTQEELLNIVHELRNNKNCTDEDLCEVIKAANQTINLENIAKLVGEKSAPEKNEGKKAAVKFAEKPKVLFNDYFLRWMQTVKKPYIKDNTYESYMQVFRANISRAFENKGIEETDSFFLQEYINGFTSEGHFRTAVKVYNLLMPCFKYAVADGVLTRNPMDKIVLPKYDQKKGSPLSRAEEKHLLDELQKTGSVYAQAFVFLLYTGLRVGELASMTMEGDWVRAVSLKGRKGLKDKICLLYTSPSPRDS